MVLHLKCAADEIWSLNVVDFTGQEENEKALVSLLGKESHNKHANS